MKPCAAWSDDCQGKKDYDGRLLSVSTRYWPGQGGGGALVYDSGSDEVSIAPYGKRPSAHASIVLNFGEPNQYGYGDEMPWRQVEIEADTESEVKAAVEAWVQARFDEIRAILGLSAPEDET